MLKNRCLDTTEEIQTESQTVHDSFTKTNFENIFLEMEKRCDHCVNAKGIDFEGNDKSKILK